ncbi:MAG: FAD-dependent monooxygenase, partial [Bacteroidota bacterium]
MKTLNIQVSPPAAENKSILEIELKNYGFDNSRDHFKILKKSIDARGKKIKINLRIGILSVSENFEPLPIRNFSPRDYSKTAIIIGAGPAGLFAALRLIELGIKPILIERGKDVRSRRRDLAL